MLALGLSVDDHASAHPDGAEIRTPLAAPTHRDASALYRHWQALDGHGGLIVGVHIPSRPLAKLLPCLSLFEPVDNARDFRVRLAGTNLLRRFGRDITGHCLSQVLDGERFDFHRTQMRRLHKSGKPFLLDIQVLRDGLTRLHFELLGLQVFSPDCRHPWIMTGQFLYDG